MLVRYNTDLDKMFGEMFGLDLHPSTTKNKFFPAVNTREDDKGYYLDIDLPGIKKEDISIDIKDNFITVSGEKKYKNEVKKEDFYKIESSYGKYSRSFEIPSNVNVNKIEAKNKNGVLELFLPKDKEEAKKIEIK